MISISARAVALWGVIALSVTLARMKQVVKALGTIHSSDPLFGTFLAIVVHVPLLFDEAYSSVMLRGFVPPLALHSIV